jgi:O-antigen ligase
VFGRGVGKVGTAAARATVSIFPGASSSSTSDTGGDTTNNSQLAAVDSGYLATIADVGIVGLIVLLAILGRAAAIGWRAARRGSAAGWLGLGLLVSMMIDALTRASFTGFPTAFLGLLLLGVCLAAARTGETRRRDPPALSYPRTSSR